MIFRLYIVNCIMLGQKALQVCYLWLYSHNDYGSLNVHQPLSHLKQLPSVSDSFVYCNVVCCKSSVVFGIFCQLSQHRGRASRHHCMLTSHQVNHCTITIKFKKHCAIAMLLIQQHYCYQSMLSPTKHNCFQAIPSQPV